jgi:hypothetical protein
MMKTTRIVLVEMSWVTGGEKHQKGKDCTAMRGTNAEGLHGKCAGSLTKHPGLHHKLLAAS